MIWFIIHNFLKNFTFIENQTKNLTTFLIGIVLYVLFYSYVGSIDFNNNIFLKRLFGFFIYILIADAFSMAIIYKNFYKQTIFTEVKETIGSNNSEKVTDENNDPILNITKENSVCDDYVSTNLKKYKSEKDLLSLLENNSEHINENILSNSHSALGDIYTTNCKSNI